MRAALGYDRSHTNAQMGTEMTTREIPLTLSQFNAIGEHHLRAAARIEALEECRMTEEEAKGHNDPTPVDLMAEARRTALAKCEMTDEEIESATGRSVAQLEIPEWVKEGNREWRNAVQAEALMADIAGFMETEFEPEPEGMYEGMRNRLWHSGMSHRPRIKVIGDQRNNVGRHCSYVHHGESLGRVWRILTPMQDQDYNTYYLVLNTESGEQCIVWDQLLHNLY